MTTQPKQYNIAIIAKNNTLYAWQYEVLKRVVALKNIKISRLLFNNSLIHKKPLTLRFLHHIERYLYHCKPNFFEEKKIDALLGLPAQFFSSDSIPSFDSIDFAINFTEEVLPDDLLSKTTLGIWSIFIGHKENVSSRLTAINDFISESDVVTLGLQIETPSYLDNVTLYKTKKSIDMASLCRTAEQCLHKTSYFIPHYLQQLSRNKKPVANYSGFSIPKQLKQSVSIGDSAKLVWQSIKRFNKKMDHKYRAKEQWALIYAHHQEKENKLPYHDDFSLFNKIIPPKDRFWADPFVVSRDNKHYIFFEELLFERDLGHLCCMELYDDGTHSDPTKIIEEPHHLSYPFIFNYNNHDYMIPESGDHQSITLYKCKNFPYQWEFEKHLMDQVLAYDSTLFEYQGLWWMFTCITEDEKLSATDDLHLFYANNPLSQNWQAHPMNPVVSNATTARPAGNVFIHNDKIYRPSQNCGKSYGAGLNFCEITQLDKTNYSETVVHEIFPDWDKTLKGLHTFNHNKHITISDVILDQR